MDIMRLLRTLRYLRPIQVASRVRRRLVRRVPSDAPAGAVRALGTPLARPVERHGSWDGADTFDLLNRRGTLTDAAGWNQRDAPKLWLYHLHYFEELARSDASAWRDRHARLIRRWIVDNPPTGGPGWEPYPIALRSVYWIKWALTGGTLDAEALDSLARQLRHLENNLEFHLLGNHLWADAKALYFGGLFFEGAEADRWFARGLQLLRRERDEQILADGGHFERSPAYHCLILEDVLDVIAISRAFGRPLGGDWERTAARMLEWLAIMTRPDGRVVAWNDAARNAVPAPDALLDYADRLGVTHEQPRDGVHHLSDTGYLRYQAGRFMLWFDVAPVGPDYIPGHAHADSLNIELSIDTTPLLVDTGTSTYDAGPRRSLERSTAAHNTVVVADADSSEVWDAFRVGRRARVRSLMVEADRATAAHDGYRHLGASHRRTVQVSGGGVVIVDELEGTRSSGVAHFHFAPGIHPERRGWTIITRLARLELEGAEDIALEPWLIADGFNDLHPAFRLVVHFTGKLVTNISGTSRGTAAGLS